MKSENIISSKDDAEKLLAKRSAQVRKLWDEVMLHRSTLAKIVDHGYVIYGNNFYRAYQSRVENCDNIGKVPGSFQNNPIEYRIMQCDQIIRALEIAVKQVPKAIRKAKTDEEKEIASSKAKAGGGLVQITDLLPKEEGEKDEDEDLLAYCIDHTRAKAKAEADAEDEAAEASEGSASSSAEWQTVEKKQKPKKQRQKAPKTTIAPYSKMEAIKVEAQMRRQQTFQAAQHRDAEITKEDLVANFPILVWNPNGKNRVEALADLNIAVFPIFAARAEMTGAGFFKGKRIRHKSIPVHSVNDIAEHCVAKDGNNQLPAELRQILTELSAEIRKVPGQTEHTLGERLSYREIAVRIGRTHPRMKRFLNAGLRFDDTDQMIEQRYLENLRRMANDNRTPFQVKKMIKNMLDLHAPRSLWGLYKSLFNHGIKGLNEQRSDEEIAAGREWKGFFKENTQTGEIVFNRIWFQSKGKDIPAPEPEPEPEPEPVGFIMNEADFPALGQALKA